MKVRLKDRTGNKYGRLTVVGRASNAMHPNGKSSTRWVCLCDCGKTVTVLGDNLESGHTKSCGCISTETPANLRHGMVGTRLYNVWTNMKQRCYNEDCPSFERYGGRGITVCDEWKDDFEAFAEWANENGFSESLTIDRVDNNSGYSPDNCRWTTMLIQRHNQERLCDWNELYIGEEAGHEA